MGKMMRSPVEKNTSGTKMGKRCFSICTEPLHILCSLNHHQMSSKTYYHADAMEIVVTLHFQGMARKKGLQHRCNF